MTTPKTWERAVELWRGGEKPPACVCGADPNLGVCGGFIWIFCPACMVRSTEPSTIVWQNDEDALADVRSQWAALSAGELAPPDKGEG